MVWYSHLFQNFPQLIVIHTVKGFGIVNKGFGIVNKAEIDVFLELSCFFDDPADIGNLISGSSAFSKTSLNIWKLTVHVLLKQIRLFCNTALPQCRTMTTTGPCEMSGGLSSKIFSAGSKFPYVPLFRPNLFIEDKLRRGGGCHPTVKPAKKSFVMVMFYY